MASNPVTRMTAAGLVCFALVVAATGGRSPFAALIGMIGPLTAAIASWILLERMHARSPEQVSGAMIKLFGAKLILFGAYAALAVLLMPAGRIVFVVSFVTHYILLHMTEAVYLRRLFAVGGAAGPRLGVS
jgi:hypothetical protein